MQSNLVFNDNGKPNENWGRKVTGLRLLSYDGRITDKKNVIKINSSFNGRFLYLSIE